MASITFTDTLGTCVFTNTLDTVAGGVGSRFADWTPYQRPIGAAAVSLGTGARSMFTFRTDYGASFRITEIPSTSLGQALRLQAHLESGGTVSVDTDDAYGRVYTSCCLAPDAGVAIELVDKTELVYAMSLTLINLNASAMLCDYLPYTGAGSILFGWSVGDGTGTGTFTRTSTATYNAL